MKQQHMPQCQGMKRSSRSAAQVKDHDGPNKWLVTATVVCGTLGIDVTMSMKNLAVPLMIFDLQTDSETIQWIITGLMLVNTALVPAVNWLTTLIGTRQVYVWAIAIWIATSIRLRGWE